MTFVLIIGHKPQALPAGLCKQSTTIYDGKVKISPYLLGTLTVDISAQICYDLNAFYFFSQLNFKAKSRSKQYLLVWLLRLFFGLFCNSPLLARYPYLSGSSVLTLSRSMSLTGKRILHFCGGVPFIMFIKRETAILPF